MVWFGQFVYQCNQIDYCKGMRNTEEVVVYN